MIHNLVKLTNTDETNEQTETAAADEHDDHDDNKYALITSSRNPKIAVFDKRVLVQKMHDERKDTWYSKRCRPSFKRQARKFNSRIQ